MYLNGFAGFLDTGNQVVEFLKSGTLKEKKIPNNNMYVNNKRYNAHALRFLTNPIIIHRLPVFNEGRPNVNHNFDHLCIFFIVMRIFAGDF